MSDAVLAVDLGGTRMRIALVDPDGRIRRREAQPTPHADARPKALLELARLAAGEADHAVIGLPGRVDHRAGRLEYAPNLPAGWVDDLDEEDLATELGLPVHLANDADLATVGEAWFGAGVGYDDVAYVTLSTGVGAGVMLDRRIVRGHRSLCELGHTVIDPAAAARGEPATVEALGSGTALARRAAAAGLPAAGADLVALVHAGDRHALEVWTATMAAAAVGIANLAQAFSPEVIVIGGGMGRNGELVLGPVREALERCGPRGLPRPVVVVGAALGDDAGLVGAAAWERSLGCPT